MGNLRATSDYTIADVDIDSDGANFKKKRHTEISAYISTTALAENA
ncbi:hypothetical protein EGR_10662 [Echinococcus granulosus]|uniref:Uncharacterized protein n=1 Tax=Echinococcus granulosus TaxID=6210 RepID=W6U0E7_ECHGR|nr:hypothetical protein EGR_10662 [Echinococcus granulosus]EUB54478.1 hypothetical protein EGR_10662 [Echinococcus granulosus]